MESRYTTTYCEDGREGVPHHRRYAGASILPLNNYTTHADQVFLLPGCIGPTEDAMAGLLLCVHIQFGNSYVLHDRRPHVLLFRPSGGRTSVSIRHTFSNDVRARELMRYVVQAFVGFSLGSVCHVCHQGLDVFTPAVRATGH